jgi:glyoxylase-like metal-dependent hydrolase (beta-lactamase superfamily II)
VIGPLRAVATPGHAAGHLAFIAGRVCFSGDAILGEGSVFVSSYPGALAAYLAGLRSLRELDLELIAPGHGPLITDPAARIDTYLAHRLERERQIAEALAEGLSEEELLDRVWPNLSPALRFAAHATLKAHLGKLADEAGCPPSASSGAGAGDDGGRRAGPVV